MNVNGALSDLLRMALVARKLVAMAVGGHGFHRGDRVTTLQDQIAERFFALLSESKEVDPEKLAHLRTLFATNKRPKAEDFLKIFSLPAGVVPFSVERERR